VRISPDAVVLWQWGFAQLNLTILFTWLVMALLLLFAFIATRRLRSDEHLDRWQNLLEAIVEGMLTQIREITQAEPEPFLPFLGSLFLFIVVANVLSVVPGFEPPTGSLSTTAALAACVFVAVPGYGIARIGLTDYLRNYIRPSPLMLPFTVIGELSRILALAMRLFGNVMSGTMIAAVLLAVTPLLFPVVMQLLGLLTGVVQAYIFAVLAAVYIGAGFEIQDRSGRPETTT
jgi:F-type H+-transporting ATPase subunit a